MTKKIVLLLAVALLAAGTVWAQAGGIPSPPADGWPPTPPGTPADPPPSPPGPPSQPGFPPGTPGLPGFPTDPPGMGDMSGLSGILRFDAARSGGISTEARSTGGLFSSDVDRIINPRFHNPDLGTFFFLSGDFNLDGNINQADRRTSVEAGFATNVGPLYLGAYYRGGIVDAFGYRERGHHPHELPDWALYNATWQNNIALIVGILGMGFRFDFIANNQTAAGHYDRGQGFDEINESVRRTSQGPVLALTWGANFGPLSPWARVGYRLAATYEFVSEGYNYRWREQLRFGEALELSAGTRFRFTPTQAVGAEFNFGSTFPQRESYSSEGMGETDFSTRRFGTTGFGLRAYYLQNVNAGIVALTVRPMLSSGITTRSNDWDGGTFSWSAPGDRWFTLTGHTDLGIRLRMTERFTLFGGTMLTLFNWTTWTQTGGDEQYPARESAWRFDGVSWGLVNDNNVNLGLTFAPMEDLVIGVGMNSLITSGFFIRTAPPDIALTVSIRPAGLRNGNGNGGAAAPAPAPAPAPAAEEAPVADDEGGAE